MQPNEWNAADAIFRRYLERPRRRRLARVVDAFYRHVWGTALRVCGNGADAADITQDVFLKLLLHPPAPDRVKSPRAFLAWEVVGRASSIRRSEDRRKAREQAALHRAEEVRVDLADVEALRAGVCELPEDLRAAVELRYFAGLRNSDIAEVLGVGERHVEKRLEEARHLLRARLGPAAAPVLLFEAHFAEDGPIPTGDDTEPPEKLLCDLLSIVASGAVLAKLSTAGVGTIVGGAAASHPVALGLALTSVLFAGGAAAIFVASRADHEERTDVATGRAEPIVAANVAEPAAAPAAEALRDAVEASAVPFGEIRVVVMDEKAARVAGARVLTKQVISSDEAEQLRKEGFPAASAGVFQRDLVTEVGGEVTFGNLLPGKIRVDVEHPPYLPNAVPTLRVKPRETRSLDMILSLPLRLFGSVRTPEGDPVQGAQVCIGFDHSKHYYADPAKPEPARDHAFEVDTKGQFDTGFGLVNTFTSGRLPLYVIAPGREMKRYQLNCDEFKEQQLRLDVVLGVERRLRVVVLDPRGAPVPDVRIVAEQLLVQDATTDASGMALLNHLPSDRALIRIQLFKDGYIEESAATTGLETEELRVVLRPHDPGIEGRVAMEALPPEAHCWPLMLIHELDANDRPARELLCVTPIEKKNTFILQPGKPLRFEVEYQVGWRTCSMKPFVYDGMHLLQVELPVRLEPPYVTGRVLKRGTREPLQGVPVRMYLPWRGKELFWGGGTSLNGIPFPGLPGNVSIVTTGADGSFIFLLSATDPYRHETPLRRRAILTAGTKEIGYSPDVAFDIDIRPDTVVKDVELEVDGFGAISGGVLDETGQPLPGALVAAFDGRWFVKNVQADSSGRFRIEGLRPGRYQVEFLGHSPHVRTGSGGGGSFPRPEEFLDLPVNVAAGQTTEWSLDLRTDALGAIDGTVSADIDGAVRAKCGQLRDGKLLTFRLFNRESKVHEGSFHVESMFPGRYRVWLENAYGAGLAETEVEVTRARRTGASIAPATGSIEIPIVGPADAPWDELKVQQVDREERCVGGAGDVVWSRVAAANVVILHGRVQLDGLVTGRIRATILVPGFLAAQTEPTEVSSGRTVAVPDVRLVRGKSVRVRLELPEGLHLTGDTHFIVFDAASNAEVAPTSLRRASDLEWQIGGLPDGTFTIYAYANGFEQPTADVTIGSDVDPSITLRLTPSKD